MEFVYRRFSGQLEYIAARNWTGASRLFLINVLLRPRKVQLAAADLRNDVRR